MSTRQGAAPGSELTAQRESAAPAGGAAGRRDAADADAGDTDAGEPGADEAEEDGEELNEEAEEQAELIARKRETLGGRGRGGTPSASSGRPAMRRRAGWAGEVPFETTAPDDWEPAVAADPSAPWVYVLVTRYGVDKPCNGNCPTPYISLRVSTRRRRDVRRREAAVRLQGLGPVRPDHRGRPANGAVYAVYMNGFNILFTKSTDHGATWSTPVKPCTARCPGTTSRSSPSSDDGKDVYIAFNGPTGGDPWIAQSHDSGTTWTQTKLVDSNRYFFAFDADVAPDGTVYFAQTGLLYGGGGNKGTYPTGAIDEHVFVSSDRGASWTDQLVATVQPGLTCSSGGCTPDYWLGHTALSADATAGSRCSTTAPHARRPPDDRRAPVDRPWRPGARR